MIMVDKILMRLIHWSARLLSFTGIIHLIRSVIFASTNYWMQSIPPKHVIPKIEAICRSFLWTNGEEIKRKSPVAWKQVCSPKKQGDPNLISLNEWNQTNMIKLL